MSGCESSSPGRTLTLRRRNCDIHNRGTRRPRHLSTPRTHIPLQLFASGSDAYRRDLAVPCIGVSWRTAWQRVCIECGNDLAADGYSLCSDCLEGEGATA